MPGWEIEQRSCKEQCNWIGQICCNNDWFMKLQHIMRYKETPSHADKCLQKSNYTKHNNQAPNINCVSVIPNYLLSLKWIFNLWGSDLLGKNIKLGSKKWVSWPIKDGRIVIDVKARRSLAAEMETRIIFWCVSVSPAAMLFPEITFKWPGLPCLWWNDFNL